MAKNNVADLLSVGSLFTTQAERDEAQRETVLDIPLEEISDFPNHPFKVRMDASMMEMVDSVKQYGVLVPALVRPKPDGGYEMIAGHRRKKASELAEKQTLSCIVRDMTDNEATIVMVDSNLQREQILPSEKAFAYKMKLEAMRRQQGSRTDLTSATPLRMLNVKSTREILAEQTGESHEQIRKYIRLTYLIPDILDLVDNSVLKEKDILQIALRPAVELSYLTEKEQQDLFEIMECEDCTPSHAQAIKMRQFSQEGRLDANVLLSIMQEEKPNQVEQFKMPKERISKFFSPGTPAKKMEDTIVKALELYRKRQRDLQQAERGIRFINPNYKELFRIPDGDKIRITYADGEKADRTCRYIDDYHVEIGSGWNSLLHICQFAEMMERNGSTVIPLRSSLPEQCYSVLPDTGELIIIKKGESGYYRTDIDMGSKAENRALADGHGNAAGRRSPGGR